MTSNTASPKGADQLARIGGADAADHPRGEVLLDALRRARRGGAQELCPELLAVGAIVDPLPVAVIHSPAEMVAAWPMTVTRSRCPRALVRSTQKPLSSLWKVDTLDQTSQHVS
jgi:hypothetical protein